jgi:hypothetical protein
MTLPAGVRLGPYEILDLVGSGGTYVVTELLAGETLRELLRRRTPGSGRRSS